MNNSIKNPLKGIIFLGIALYLIPTLADMFGRNASERDSLIYWLSNAGATIQVIAILLTVLSAAVYLLIVYKEKRSLTVLKQAGKKDSLWDEVSLKFQTRSVFYMIQACLKNQETGSLQGYATKEFITWFKTIVAQNNNESAVIDITETRIISCQDSLNDAEDKFTGYIKGSFAGPGNEESSAKEFSEMYHFRRSGNAWLLYKIDAGNVWNLLYSPGRFEE